MKLLVVNRKFIVSIVLVLMSFCFMAEEIYGAVSISEIMYGSEIRFSPKQWIEISNSGSQAIDLTGWTLTLQNVDSEDLTGPVTATINFRDTTFEDAPRIWPNDFLLIVTSKTDDNSGGFAEDQIYDLRWIEGARKNNLDISFNTIWLSVEGFYIKLTDKDGNLVDEVGNYDGTTTLWDLPYNFNRGRIRAGNRTSLIRCYSNDVALDGTLASSWVSAVDANLTADQKTYYGDETDISSPGIGIIADKGQVPTPPQVIGPETNVEETTPPQVIETPGTDPVTQQPTSTSVVQLLPASVVSPAVGEQITFNLNITNGKSVAGYQATVQFDTTALRYVSGANGDYLPAGAFFVQPKVEGNFVKLNAASLAGESNGDGPLATLTFEVVAVKASTLTLSDVLLSNKAGETSVPSVENAEITELSQLKGDVNGDGVVNIQDLVLVAFNIGQTGRNTADVNGDGLVNIVDLVLVAGALGTSAAAPSLLHSEVLEMLTSTNVHQWLSQAQQLGFTDAMSQRGILFLQQLLAVLIPKETALLANYPNPFNPETWIPYQLAKDADVTLTIYAMNGRVVRRLALGHQPAGVYQTRSRAAYWDGRNAFGEPVASGVYFYTLIAGDFTATRKMLIRK